ncbi:MAG: hypothetical protein M3R25_04810 [Bacteroidota bacterium]|nr:hypothetical protein [Bacteroidota bacterium]
MNINEFIQSTKEEQPPNGLNIFLLSLWYDAKGDWEKSHDLISDIETKEAAWIHAYLHRKEGDHWNADYWYRRAGEKRPEISLQDEWNLLIEWILKKV